MDAACLVPSCAQEQWYLHHVEGHSDGVFARFGHSVEEFRRCVFHSARRPCSRYEDSAYLESSEEVLQKLPLSLRADELNTASELVREFMDPEEESATDDGHTMERALFQRRSRRSATSDVDLVTHGKQII